jgi:Protein of unknown function (DUF3634)
MMHVAMFIPLLAVSVVFALYWFTRQSDLFTVSVRGGRMLVVRGRVPPALLADMGAVVARPPVSRATIRAVKGESGARLVFSGALDEAQQQRLRNVFALCTLARLRQAPVIARPNLGQLLGIASLAWWLTPRR